MVLGLTPFSWVTKLCLMFSTNSVFDNTLVGPTQIQSFAKNFASAESFCCSSLAVSVSIPRSSRQPIGSRSDFAETALPEKGQSLRMEKAFA